MVALDLARRALERARQARRGAGRGAARQPGAQLALLAAGERRHRARVVGALLDERQRLEHRVVQVGGHLGALLGADALAALGGQRAREAQDPRGEDDRQHGRDDQDGEHDVAGGAQRAGRGEEDQPGGDDERDPQAGARGDLRRRRRGRRGLALPGRPGRRLAPQQRGARGDEHDRPDQGVRRPEAERAEGQQRAEDEQADTEGDLDRAAPGEAPAPEHGGALVGGQEHPGERVEGDPQPAGERDADERRPDEQRVDAELAREARAHPGDDPVRGVAAQGVRGRGFGHRADDLSRGG